MLFLYREQNLLPALQFQELFHLSNFLNNILTINEKYLDIFLYIWDYLVHTENFVKQYIYSFRPVINNLWKHKALDAVYVCCFVQTKYQQMILFIVYCWIQQCMISQHSIDARCIINLTLVQWSVETKFANILWNRNKNKRC